MSVAPAPALARPQATVLWAGQSFHVELEPGEPLLQACLRQGIPIPHQCRAGRCGRCVGRRMAGQVEMRGGEGFRPAIPEAALARGAVLACSSFPEGSGACIAFDPLITEALLPKDAAAALPAPKPAAERFDLLSSLAYGWLTISLVFPLLIELVILPLFSLVLSIDHAVLRGCVGGAVVLTSFVIAPLVHFLEATIFRLPARFDLLGRVPLAASLKAPAAFFPAAVVIWLCIEWAIARSSGVYRTPTIGEMFVYLTVIQLSNLFVMDLVFWLVHGPLGLHHPAVFKRLHAKHHRQRVSTFSTGPDLAPIDMIAEVSIFTVVPVACGLLLGIDSLAFVYCSLINTLMTSTWAHSPYRIDRIVPQASVTQYVLYAFPWLVANPHAAHHALVECNYAIWGFWDKVLGTFRPMTPADEQAARAIHLADLARPETTSTFHPPGSRSPWLELAGAWLLCALLWALAAAAHVRPQMRIESALLPWPATASAGTTQAAAAPSPAARR